MIIYILYYELISFNIFKFVVDNNLIQCKFFL